MEDLDLPRVMPGAAEDILRTLEAFGMGWDGPVLYQSARNESYRAALDQLHRLGVLYHCACTRREIADSSISGPHGAVYPGTCRIGLPAGREPRAVRVRTDDAAIHFEDVLQGSVSQILTQEIGDFVLHRADGLFAYQLAVVVDDAEQNVTEVVRGGDLLDSTPRQIYLQRLLDLPTPSYMHLPVAVNQQGEKLSKQTLAEPIMGVEPVPLLLRTLGFLNQQPPPELAEADLDSVWQWAMLNWDTGKIPRVLSLPAPGELHNRMPG
jgi:glutamyl-Q tRNA(Asp) synthetase